MQPWRWVNDGRTRTESPVATAWSGDREREARDEAGDQYGPSKKTGV